MIRAKQIRAARALIGWEQRQLAEASKVSLPTVKRMEGSDGPVRGNYKSVSKVLAALENAGVELIEETDKGSYGVRITKARESVTPKDSHPVGASSS